MQVGDAVCTFQTKLSGDLGGEALNNVHIWIGHGRNVRSLFELFQGYACLK